MKACPNLFIIGTPKSYTTSLHDWLSTLPSVAESSTKEIGTLLGSPWADQPWTLRSAQYPAGPNQYRLDSNPWVFYDQSAPGRLLQSTICGSAKVLISLREPVARACSMHRDIASAGLEREGIDEAFQREISRHDEAGTARDEDYPIRRSAYLQQSNYRSYLAPWLDGFDPDRLRIFFPEAEHGPQLLELCRWLGVGQPTVEDLPTSNLRNASRPLSPYIDAMRRQLRHRAWAFRLWRRMERFAAPAIFKLSNLQRGTFIPAADLSPDLAEAARRLVTLDPTAAHNLERYTLGPLPAWVNLERLSPQTASGQGDSPCAESSA